MERLFDLARSIDVHVESQRASGERAVSGVTSGLIGEGELGVVGLAVERLFLSRYLARLIKRRGQFLAGGAAGLTNL